MELPVEHQNNETIEIVSRCTLETPIHIVGDYEEFKCPCCKELYTWPIVTTCGHILNKQCLRICDDQVECPICKKVLAWTAPHIKMEQDVRELKARCPNEKEGCEIVFSIKDMVNHLKKCKFELVKCKFQEIGCEVVLTRSVIHFHEEERSEHFELLSSRYIELKTKNEELTVATQLNLQNLQSSTAKSLELEARNEELAVATQVNQDHIQSLQSSTARYFYGSTKSEEWVKSGEGIRVNVDLSAYQLNSEPTIVCCLHGTGGHWKLTGGSCPYHISSKGFDISIPGTTLTEALAFKYRIQFMGHAS